MVKSKSKIIVTQILRKFKKLKVIFLILLITFPVYFSLFHRGYFYMQDDLQAFRILELNECVKDFQLPCRWVPDAGYGYGYPQFNFYSPGVYYLGEILHFTGLQYINIVKLLFILGYILSAFTIYLLVRELAGFIPGVASAILYTYVPYKAVEVYVRGALSEFWSLVLFPLIFWSSFKFVKSSKFKYGLVLSLSLAGLLITHTLMSLIFIPLLLFWILFWIIVKKRSDLIIKFLVFEILAVSLSSFFILPLVFERKFVHSESLLGGYFDYRAHFVNLYRLFISREWGYGSSGFPNEKLNLSTGLVQWIIGLIAVIVAFVRLKKDKVISILVFFFGCLRVSYSFYDSSEV